MIGFSGQAGAVDILLCCWRWGASLSQGAWWDLLLDI